MFGVSPFAAAPFASQAGSTYSETVSELANASILDVDSRVDFVGTVSETLSLADSPIPIGVYLVTVTENATGNDDLSATITRVGLVQENTVASIVLDGATAYALMIANQVNAADTVVGLLQIDSSITEAGAVADVAAGEREFLRIIEEGGSIAEVTDRQLDAAGNISESLSSSVTVSSRGDLVATISEILEAAETTLGNADYIITISEGTVGTDITIRRLQWEIIDTSDGVNWQTVPTLN